MVRSAKQTLSKGGSTNSRPFSLVHEEQYMRSNGVIVSVRNRLHAALTKTKLTNDTVVYHGTSRVFNKFERAQRKSNTPVDEVNAFFFTTDIRNAYNHALRSAKETGGKARIISAKIDFNKLMDVTARIKRYQKEMGNFGVAKRRAYAEVDATKFDGIEFRGDSVNTPEYVVFNPSIIKIIEPTYKHNDDKKLEANTNVYGYWFTDKGEQLEVASYRHDQVAEDYIKTHYADQFYKYLEDMGIKSHNVNHKLYAIKNLGWIRWANEEDDDYNSINLEIEKGKVAVKAFNKFNEILKDTPFKALRLDVHGSNDLPVIEYDNRTKPVIREIRKNLNKTLTAEDYLEASTKEKTTVLKNPPFSRIQALIKNAVYNELKGLIVGNDVYIWNNNENWHHAQQAIKLGIVNDKTPVIRQMPKFDDIRLTFMYDYDKNNEKLLTLVNASKDIEPILANKYLRGIIKEGDLYLDGDDPSKDFAFIRGIDYMKEHNLEAAIDEPYGYWIKPDGTLNEVGFSDHWGFLIKSGINAGAVDATYKKAFDAGWVRIVLEYGGEYAGIELKYGAIGNDAYKTLVNYIRTQCPFDQYYIDFRRPDNGIVPAELRTHQQYNDNGALKVLRQALNREMVAQDAYGYWITGDGKLLEVPYQGHDSVAEKYIVRNLYNEYFNYVMKNDSGDYNSFCLSIGWVRVVNRGQELSVQFKEKGIDPNAARALVKYLKDNYFDSIILDITDDKRSVRNSRKFDTESQIAMRELSGLIRSNINRNEMTADDQQYGYWFTADGEQLDVDEMQHEQVAERYIKARHLEERYKQSEADDYKEYAMAFLGWIRTTITDDMLYVEVKRDSVEPEAYKRLVQFVNKEDTSTEYYSDVSGKYKWTDKKVAMLNVIKENVVKKTMEAANPWGVAEAWWITDEGKVLEVKEEHDDTAAPYFPNVQPKYKVIDTALKKGWIRIRSYGNGNMPDNLAIQLEHDSLNTKTISAFAEFMNEFDNLFSNITTSVYLENEGEDYKRYEPYTKNDLGKILQTMRKHIKKKTLEASTSEPYFSQQALRRANEEADSRKSRTTLIMMKPSDFLKMAEPAFSKDKYEKAKQLNKDRVQYNDVPFLIFENNGDKTATVVGHEGRHRSMILKELGDRPMPVLFKSVGGKGGAIRWGSQDDEFDKIDVWPEELMGEGANKRIRISFPDSEYYPRNKKMEAADTKGFWIDADGKIIEFTQGNTEHFEEAEKHFGGFGYAALYKALESGWIRARTFGNTLIVTVGVDSLHDKGIKALMRYLKENYFEKIELAVQRNIHPVKYIEVAGDTKGTNAVYRLLKDNSYKAPAVDYDEIDRMLKELEAKELEALDESEDTFECWVTDKGIVLSTHSHLRTLKSIIFKKGADPRYTEKLKDFVGSDFNSNSQAYNYGIRQLGWIRVVGSPKSPSLMFADKGIDPNAYRHFLKMWKERVDPNELVFTDRVVFKEEETNFYNETLFKEFKKSRELFSFMSKNVKKNTLEAAFLERKYLTRDEMIKQGADGHLTKAVKCMIPLDKIDGLEPVPAASEGNDYVKGKKITQPIEVEYQRDNDVYILYAGNHRVEQARINGDKMIIAFVQPDGGKLGLHVKPITASSDAKVIVAIDEDNNIQWVAKEAILDTWKTGNKDQRIELTKRDNDYIVRQFNPDGSLDGEDVYRFQETANSALMQMVIFKQKENLFYNKETDMGKVIEAAEDEKILERWETGDEKYAMVLGFQNVSYFIRTFMKNAITKNWHVAGTSYLGKATQKEAEQKFAGEIKGFNDKGMGFKKVKVPNTFTPPSVKKQTEIAQVSVRGKVGAGKSSDGFTLFSKQPNIPGLEVATSKAGSSQYAKIKHQDSGLDLLNMSNKPLAFSPTELVQRINNYPPFKRIDWTLPKDSLFKKYGAQALIKVAQDFLGTLNSTMYDAADEALEGGLAETVKAYLVARFTARPDAARNMKRQIDFRIKQDKLNADKIYNYFGDAEDRTKVGRDKLFANIGLERTDDGIKILKPAVKPNLKETVQPKPQTREAAISDRIERQKALRRASESTEVERAPVSETNVTNSMIGDYVEGIKDDGSKARGIVLTQAYDKKKGMSSGTLLIETPTLKTKTTVVKVSKMKRLLVKAPKGLVSLYNIATAERRLKTAKK